MTKRTPPKKTSLRYELYGSSNGAQGKGFWRRSIFADREKKPLAVDSFYGSLADAKEHAEAAILRLKERTQKRNTPL